jgi:hypothetical protein
MGLSLQKEAMYPTVAALRQIALPENQANRTLDTGC